MKGGIIEMKDEQVISSIEKILEEKVGMKIEQLELNSNTKISDIGISSINYIKMLIALEEEFDIEFKDEQFSIQDFGEVGVIVDYIVEQNTI